MKKTVSIQWAGLLTVAAGLLFSGCEGGGDGNGGGGVGGAVSIQSIGAEETIAAIDGAHPNLTVDTQNQVILALDKDRGVDLYLYKRAGAWTGGLLGHAAPGGEYDASRMYLPSVAVDANNRAYIACTLGNKAGGAYLGQGFFAVDQISSSPSKRWFRFFGATPGTGIAATDPQFPDEVVLMTLNGLWRKYSPAGDVIGEGQLNLGESGEKIDMEIAPRPGKAGLWHMAMCGIQGLDSHYNGLDGQYQNSDRQAAGLPAVSWAAKDAYPEMAPDFIHPSLTADLADPEVCYIAAAFSNGVSVNVWSGDRMLFNTATLPVVDPQGSIGIERMGPAWAPVKGGGAYLAWTRQNRIKMRLVRQDGTFEPDLSKEPIDICAGSRAALCTDRNGVIHLVYNLNKTMQYRQITLAQ